MYHAGVAHAPTFFSIYCLDGMCSLDFWLKCLASVVCCCAQVTYTHTRFACGGDTHKKSAGRHGAEKDHTPLDYPGQSGTLLFVFSIISAACHNGFPKTAQKPLKTVPKTVGSLAKFPKTVVCFKKEKFFFFFKRKQRFLKIP